MAISFSLPEPSRLTPVREDPDAYFAHAWERALDEAQENLERESSDAAQRDTDRD